MSVKVNPSHLGPPMGAGVKNPAVTICTATAAALAVSAAGGTTGAALLWFTDGGLLIDWLIILVGWPLTAGLSWRLFLHKVMDDARRDIVSAIRAEQNRNGKAYGLSRLFPSHQSSNLLMVMEEYEILFPETRRVRAQLGQRINEIDRVYPPLVAAIFDEGRRDAAIEQLEQRLLCHLEYVAVLEDLSRHVQNATPAEVTGRTIPPRTPKDKSFPLMSKRADGLLDISANGVSWPGGDDLTPKRERTFTCLNATTIGLHDTHAAVRRQDSLIIRTRGRSTSANSPGRTGV